MKKLLAFGLFLLCGAAKASDAVETNAHAFETVTVTTSAAVGLTSGNYVTRAAFGPQGGGTVYLFCTVETDNIRFRADGTDPTRSVGHPVPAGTSFTVQGYNNVRSLKMIGSGSASASVSCTFEKSVLK